MRILKYIFLGTVILLGLATVGFVVWANTPPAPLPAAAEALQSNSQIQVVEDGWIVFQPTEAQPDTGLIIYPGGRIDPHAYAPIARAIAQEGYLVVIVPMPLNLAVTDSDRALEVITAYPDIEHWVVGGHSLGGAMAARFANRHPDAVQGLALWAAYPASSDNLSDQSLKAVSIIGSQDGLGTSLGVEETRHLLPENTQFVVIEGGNHAQFGSYGDQAGDNPASISPDDQQAQAVAATLRLLESVR